MKQYVGSHRRGRCSWFQYRNIKWSFHRAGVLICIAQLLRGIDPAGIWGVWPEFWQRKMFGFFIFAIIDTVWPTLLHAQVTLGYEIAPSLKRTYLVFYGRCIFTMVVLAWVSFSLSLSLSSLFLSLSFCGCVFMWCVRVRMYVLWLCFLASGLLPFIHANRIFFFFLLVMGPCACVCVCMCCAS